MFAPNCGHLSEPAHYRKTMKGRIASQSAMTNAYDKPLHNNSSHNIVKDNSAIHRLLIKQSMVQS